MDTQDNIQKRKRADTTEDTIIVEVPADFFTNATPKDKYDNIRHGLPSNIEDNPEDSDIDQDDKDKLENSTLFWTNQRIISARMTLVVSSLQHQMKGVPNSLSKLFII